MEQTVWIARHGNRVDFLDPAWEKTAWWPNDPGLAPDGIVQARQLAARLKGEPIQHIFSSPFLRTLETASYAAEVLRLPVKIEAGLSEWMNPRWYGKGPVLLPAEERDLFFPCLDKGYTSCVMPAYPETEAEMEARVARTVEELLARHSGDMLLFGHGASVSAAVYALTGLGEEVETPLCCLLKLVRTGDGWRLENNGDMSHLSDPDRTVRWV